MIIRSKTPLRLGLAGGGSDVSPYSDLYGGLILNATINLYAYCTIEEDNSGRITIRSYDDNCFETHPIAKEMKIEGGAILIKGVYNRLVRDFDIRSEGFAITTYNDAPPGSGLGTSSTMIVGIIKAFVEWMGLPLGDYEIARLAYEIERKDLGLSGGKQDQYSATFGGFNFMEFLKNDMVIVNPLKVKRWITDELESSIILYYTGASRSSAAIIDEQRKNTESGNCTAVEAMHRIKQSAIDMKLAILKGDMDSFAAILEKSWEDKKKMAGAISNPVIQQAFDVAIAAGAKSGKVSGAGGGGFIMFFADPARRADVINALSKLQGRVVPFQFTEGGAHGWKIY
ncbi:MAG: dehydrogenase [Bacteroidales bacterium]|nr:dehydrogenase [Bacteroidales bacterium]